MASPAPQGGSPMPPPSVMGGAPPHNLQPQPPPSQQQQQAMHIPPGHHPPAPGGPNYQPHGQPGVSIQINAYNLKLYCEQIRAAEVFCPRTPG